MVRAVAVRVVAVRVVAIRAAYIVCIKYSINNIEILVIIASTD